MIDPHLVVPSRADYSLLVLVLSSGVYVCGTPWSHVHEDQSLPNTQRLY